MFFSSSRYNPMWVLARARTASLISFSPAISWLLSFFRVLYFLIVRLVGPLANTKGNGKNRTLHQRRSCRWPKRRKQNIERDREKKRSEEIIRLNSWTTNTYKWSIFGWEILNGIKWVYFSRLKTLEKLIIPTYDVHSSAFQELHKWWMLRLFCG